MNLPKKEMIFRDCIGNLHYMRPWNDKWMVFDVPFERIRSDTMGRVIADIKDFQSEYYPNRKLPKDVLFTLELEDIINE